MLRKKKIKSKWGMVALAASLMALVTVTPATAQQCKDGVCTIKQPTEVDSNYRFQIGRAQYDYPSYSEDRFPEFQHLRSREDDYRRPSRRLIDREYLTRDERRPSYRSSDEWREYGRDLDRRDLDRRDRRERSRDYLAPRDFEYSGYDYSNEPRRRPVRERRPSEDLRKLRDQLEGYHRRDDRLDTLDRDEMRIRFPSDLGGPGRLPMDRRYEELPAPRENESKQPTLDQKVTSRYSDPNVVRFAQTLSGSRALALFREVSTLIDQRHLSPKSYSERLRNAARTIDVALQNRAFRNAVQVQASESQLSQFRSELSRLTNRNVRSQSEAEQVVQSAMQLGQRYGLRPGLVGYEFANGSIQSLDRFSALDPSAHRVSGSIEEGTTKTAQSSLDEYVTGIGVEIRHHRDGLEIVRVLRGGPAVQAGIQSGDIIRQIDGRNIGGMEMNSSVAMISGSSGTGVRLLIAREGRGTKTFNLVRRQFRVYSVNDVKMVDRQNGVGYLHLNKFARSSAAEMDQAIQELRSQGMRNLIVDVRGNPGGLLTTAIEVSDKFLRCGRIVATRGRLASDNSVESASANGTWSMPLVVLVDGDSASASEIFAAAIQENGRGIVVGQQSYGKGTVQTHFPLASGMGTVRLTTAKFYSPRDREMSGAGVTPDVRTADDKQALARAVTAASHPRLAEMVAQHGTCRPTGSDFRNFGSAERPTNDLSAILAGK